MKYNAVCAKSEENYLRNYDQKLFHYFKTGDHLVYTYDVLYHLTDLKWSSRWDHYLNSQKDDMIHWFSIFYSILIMFIFSTIIAWILFRILKKDIDTFNSRGSISDDIIDDSGWKQISRDVFRKPKYSSLLCILLGTGYQVRLFFLF